MTASGADTIASNTGVGARILIALALLGALAGCQESGFDESKETQRPLKVQDVMNPLNGTKVPGQAERPATLTADALGDTLALKVTPVVASDVPGYMRAAARGVRAVKDTDLSAIRAATPDLILGSREEQVSEYLDLSKIAPTIFTEGDDWKMNLREHGEALGRTNDSEALLTDWDNRLATVQGRIGKGDVSVLLLGPSGKPVTPGPLGRAVMNGLGVRNGSRGKTVLRIHAGPQWSSGG